MNKKELSIFLLVLVGVLFIEFANYKEPYIITRQPDMPAEPLGVGGGFCRFIPLEVLSASATASTGIGELWQNNIDDIMDLNNR